LLPASRLIRTVVDRVGHAVSVAVGAAVRPRRARLFRALIDAVEYSVAVAIGRRRAGASACLAHPRLVRTRIVRVANLIVIPVRAAVGSFRSWLVRTRVHFVGNPVVIAVGVLDHLDVNGSIAALALCIVGPHS
jgi:hypothetical protein